MRDSPVAAQREIADKRSRQNNFTRQLADISRTLTAMGLYHVTQVGPGMHHGVWAAGMPAQWVCERAGLQGRC